MARSQPNPGRAICNNCCPCKETTPGSSEALETKPQDQAEPLRTTCTMTKGSAAPFRDDRSEEAKVYRRRYKTARWRSIRASQLSHHPLCALCLKAGRVTPATVCDHIDPHRGDEDNFWSGPFQSLCDQAPWRCHSSKKQQQEAIGYSTEVGADGLPTDPAHPWNASI